MGLSSSDEDMIDAQIKPKKEDFATDTGHAVLKLVAQLF